MVSMFAHTSLRAFWDSAPSIPMTLVGAASLAVPELARLQRSLKRLSVRSTKRSMLNKGVSLLMTPCTWARWFTYMTGSIPQVQS